jgi:hypothetical protein
MESNSQDQAFKVVITGQRDHVAIQIIASKTAYLNLINGLMPLASAALLAAEVFFFLSPNTGGQGPPAFPANSCPRIEAPAVRQGESA